MQAPAAGAMFERLSHWAVVAAGVLITTAATRSDAAVRLLRAPQVVRGAIAGGVATATAPGWFPLQQAILATEEGELYSRVADLALPCKLRKSADTVEYSFDLAAIGAPMRSRAFTLSYFPWFRFLTEPVGFDAEDSVADYVGGCMHLFAVREGVPARLEHLHDACVVHCDNGVTVRVEGMEQLQRIALEGADGAGSSFDFEAMRLVLDRRMFPDAFEAGHRMLAAGGRLVDIEASEEGDRFVMQLVRGRG